MNKRRFTQLSNYSLYREAQEPDGGDVTQEEFDKGYHYCYDWDGLFIGPDCPEFEVCTCHPLKRISYRGKDGY